MWTFSARAVVRSRPNGFSMTTRFQSSPSGSVTMPAAAKAVDDGGEEIGIGRQVKEPVAGQPPLLLQVLDPLPQAEHAFELAEIGAVVEEPRDEPLHRRRPARPHRDGTSSGPAGRRRETARRSSSAGPRRRSPTPRAGTRLGAIRTAAGRSLRAVRSPVAPKITSTAGCTSGFWPTGGTTGSAEDCGSVWAEA